MNKYVKIVILAFMILTDTTVFSQPESSGQRNEFPELPDQFGFAGMYAGTIADAVLVAGGANFPDKMPWEGGLKLWSDAIYMLEKNAVAWKKMKPDLPIKMAYGVSVSHSGGIILAGGSGEGNMHLNQTFFLTIKEGTFHIKPLAPMPVTLANMCGDLVGDYLFIAGGSEDAAGLPTQSFLAYDIKRDEWEILKDIPGPARINAVSSAAAGKFYLFSGIQLISSAQGIQRNMLTDAYSFTPEFTSGRLNGGKWRKLADMPRGMAAGPSPAPVLNKNFIALFGGLDQQTAQYPDPKTHPGFLPDILRYDLKNNSWKYAGKLPANQVRLTLPTVIYHRQCLLISGETGPGARTNKVLAIDIN